MQSITLISHYIYLFLSYKTQKPRSCKTSWELPDSKQISIKALNLDQPVLHQCGVCQNKLSGFRTVVIATFNLQLCLNQLRCCVS